MNMKPYLRALFVAGTVVAAGCAARSYKEPVPKELISADPSVILSADPMFLESGADPELLLSLIPDGYVAVGYNSCAYRAAGVRHNKLRDGLGSVNYTAGESVAKHRWGPIFGLTGCSLSTGTVYDPEDPHDDYMESLKEGDVVHERRLTLFSPGDIHNYFSGNRKGHPLCYPVNCPPLAIEFYGVNGINKIMKWNEHDVGNVLWRK